MRNEKKGEGGGGGGGQKKKQIKKAHDNPCATKMGGKKKQLK